VNRVDKARLGAAFSRGAAAYDEHARVQRAVVARVLALAATHAPAPRRALDVGAGTGALLEALLARHPGLAAAGVDLAPGMARAARERTGPRHVVGDAERLPLRDACVDLVVSTSTFQWLPALGPALGEVARVLEPGGVAALALFGGETLRELRGAWRAALPATAPDRTHRFHRRAAVEAALAAAGLDLVHAAEERHVEHHPDALALLRALRRIGAGNAAPDRPRGLAEGRVVTRMAAAYERLRGPHGVPATWDVVYAVARRPPRRHR
jgi:malonyl-CoA O-methyltransferase